MCKSLLQAFLKGNARLLLDEKLSEETIADCRLKLGAMKSKAPYAQCSIRFSEASKLLDQQIDLMRSLRIYVEKQEERLELSKMPVEFVVRTLLEPLANKQRLQILKALAGETKTFSVLSERINFGLVSDHPKGQPLEKFYRFCTFPQAMNVA
jgi:hypothetical protein